MFEYIKRIGLSIGFITEKIDESQENLKELFNKASLDLVELAQAFRFDDFKMGDLDKLENKILFLVDLIDFSRISGFVSPMNAKVFTDSMIAFLKHILNLKDQKNHFYLSVNNLKELDEKMARMIAKENVQSQFVGENNLTNFDFTNVNFSKKTEIVSEKTDHKTEPLLAPKKILEESMITPINEDLFVESLEQEIEARKERILRTLIAGGGSIKEIASKMRDVNEKTIQRDLLGLMRDKKVIMLGKKRWAKYYLK